MVLGVDVKSFVPFAFARRQPLFVEWLNAMWFIYGWAAREHYLNLQAMRPAPAETPPGATRIPSPRLRELADSVALMPPWSANGRTGRTARSEAA